ncbi:unnamed protein product [Gordionus sp. m RMFG-2023]
MTSYVILMFPYVDDGGQPQVAWVYYQSKGIVTGEQFGSNQGCLSYEIQHCDHRITDNIWKYLSPILK